MAGWISLHRQIKSHWIWEDPQKLKWWIDILLRVNHKDNKTVINNKLVIIKRGTFHTSEVKLAEQWSVSRNTVRSFLKLLESDEMISTNRTTNGTTVEVRNYNDYQTFSEEKKQPTAQPNEQHSEQEKDSTLNSGLNTNNKENNDLIMNNNENKENKTDDSREIISFYENNGYGTINGSESERIVGWLEEGFTKDAIIKAYQIGVDNSKRGKSYIDGIFRNWRNAKTYTVKEIDANDQKRQSQRRNGSKKPYNGAHADMPEHNRKLMEERAAQREADMHNDNLPF